MTLSIDEIVQSPARVLCKSCTAGPTACEHHLVCLAWLDCLILFHETQVRERLKSGTMHPGLIARLEKMQSKMMEIREDILLVERDL